MVQREDFKVMVDMRPRWGDMDAYGHVNNAVYFTYFENARTDYFHLIGVSLQAEGQYGPILASTSCDFHKPLTHDISIQVALRATRLGNSSFTLNYAIFEQGADVLFATGQSVIVWIDLKTGKSTPLPEEIRAHLKQDMMGS